MSPSDFIPRGEIYAANVLNDTYKMAIDPASPGGDGVALFSMSHPEGIVTVHDVYTLDPGSLETIEINVLAPAAPELAYAYADLEFNEEFGPIARVRLARQRADARMERKMHRRARYMRRHGQSMHSGTA